MIRPPNPKKKKKNLLAHGDKREDYYYWLRDDKRKNKQIIKYLNDENNYSNYWFKKNKVNSKSIFQQYKQALPDFEEGLKTKIDNFQYFSTSTLSKEYRKYFRVFKGEKKLILDVNKLAKNKKFYEISAIYPSRNIEAI